MIIYQDHFLTKCIYNSLTNKLDSRHFETKTKEVVLTIFFFF